MKAALLAFVWILVICSLSPSATADTANWNLEHIVKWVQRDGKQHLPDGRRLMLPAILVSALRLGNEAIPVRQKAYGPDDNPEITVTAYITDDDRRAFIVSRKELGYWTFWLHGNGQVLVLMRIKPGGSPQYPPIDAYVPTYDDTMTFLMKAAPKPGSP